jgi:two-component system, cell cycle sensor histidine kinase and response regulator CckA
MLNTNQTPAYEIQPTVPIDTYCGLCSARGTILVVEDEAFVRDAACDILEAGGYQVLRARNAVEARAAFRHQQGSVQLLLSDVVLPGQSGPALADDLRAARPTVKILFISG